MKKLTSIVLILLVLLNSLVYSVIIGNYVINKQMILDKFCVNKALPELNCDGKCYLAQQLQAEKDKKDGESEHLFALDFGLYIPSPSGFFGGVIDTFFEISHRFHTNERFAGAYFHSVDIPPKL